MKIKLFILIIALSTFTLFFSGCATGILDKTTQIGPEQSPKWFPPTEVKATDAETQSGVTEEELPVDNTGSANKPQTGNFSAGTANGYRLVSRPADTGRVMTNAELTKIAQNHQAWLNQLTEAVKELSLIAKLQAFYLRGGKGVVMPIRHYFKPGSSKPSASAKKDYKLICDLDKAGKVRLSELHGFTDPSGSFEDNQRIVWQRIDNTLALSCCDAEGVEKKAYVGTHFNGKVEHNRSTIGFVTILNYPEVTDLVFEGDTLPGSVKKPEQKKK